MHALTGEFWVATRSAASAGRAARKARQTTALVAEPASGFEIRVQSAGKVVYVEPAGELDLATTPELQQQIEVGLIAEESAHVVIDLRQLTFCDVSGLRLLISLTTAAKSDGWRLSLIAGPPAVQRIFTLTDTLARLPFISPNALVRAVP